jgi:manganese/zinc/iron transport system permease protein
MTAFIDALTFRAGYNAGVVMLGAILLGLAAGYCGTFLHLRKRALVADGVAHATLPGMALAFLAMVAAGSDGRNLVGLFAGAAFSAAIGLLAIEWITRRTRLAEDVAIGAVLSSFFGLGIVLLTLIQTLPSGRQAGLQGFLLGSTAGMLRADALVIAAGGFVAILITGLLSRSLTLVAFDPGYAAVRGVNIRRMDRALLLLIAGVTLIALKLVGLILAVALLIIPSVAARFWTDRTPLMALGAAVLGGLSAWIGAAMSAAWPATPTGPMIVLIAFAFFSLSFVFGGARGVMPITRTADRNMPMERG